MVPILRHRDLESALLPQPVGIQAYIQSTSQLWVALLERSFVVLDLDELGFAPLQNALEASNNFFTADDSFKMNANCAIHGEGYEEIFGKESLCTRLGSNSWGSGRLRPHHHTLEMASAEMDRLGRNILSAMCRSAELDMHPAELLRLMDDEPVLRGRPAASVLRCHRCSEAGPSAAALHCAPQYSRGVLTLLTSLQAEGLQVQLPPAAGGQWVDVPLGPGRVAVLAGYSLSYALGGLLQPALHRVRPGSGPACCTASMAYELCFRPAARVDPAAITAEAAAQPSPGLPLEPLRASQLMRTPFHAGAAYAANAANAAGAGAAPWPSRAPQQLLAPIGPTVGAAGAAVAAQAAEREGGTEEAEKEPQRAAKTARVEGVSSAAAAATAAAVAAAAAAAMVNAPSAAAPPSAPTAVAAAAVVAAAGTSSQLAAGRAVRAVGGAAVAGTAPLPDLCICIQGWPSGGRVSFNVRPSTRLRKVFHTYSIQYNRNFCFLLDGFRLGGDVSVQEVSLRIGDVIDAFLPQGGGDGYAEEAYNGGWERL